MFNLADVPAIVKPATVEATAAYRVALEADYADYPERTDADWDAMAEEAAMNAAYDDAVAVGYMPW